MTVFWPWREKLAALKGTEAALILNSGFQANVSILPALADRETLILSDQLNHSSIVQGVLLSGAVSFGSDIMIWRIWKNSLRKMSTKDLRDV